MKKIFNFILIFSLFFILFGISSIRAASGIYHITTNPSEDCDSSMNVAWQTDLTITSSYLEYTLKNDDSWTNSITLDGECEENRAYTSLNASGKVFNKCGLTLKDLDSGTEYKYRIASSPTNVTDVRSFKTGSQYFSFAWISDFHAYYGDERRLVNATKAINQATSLNGGDVDFVLSTGDMVSYSGSYIYWTQVFDSINSPWSKTNMICNTLGNHDYETSAGESIAAGGTPNFMRAQFNNPKNGFNPMMNICYYFYFGDTLFISLSSMEYSVAQFNWAEEVLKNNKAQYIIMFQHYGMFMWDTAAKRSDGYNRWRTLCDKYDVDMFLSGNEHIYYRSKLMYNDVVSTDEMKGTYYLVAPSSDGERGRNYSWSTLPSYLQTAWTNGSTTIGAGLINVSETGIRVRIVDQNGVIRDDFSTKAKRGPSDRYEYKDLTGFDKKAFESRVSYVPSGLQIGQKGYLFIPFDGLNNLRKVVVKDSSGSELYILKPKPSSGSMYQLNHFEIGIYNIEIHYKDDTVRKMGVYNSVNMGLLENLLVIKNNNNKVQLKFTNKLASIASKIEVYLDGELVASGGPNASFINVDNDKFYEKYIVYVMDEFDNILLDYRVSALYGDYNLDGVLDNKDCEELANMILLNKGVVDEKQDLNGDGKLDIIDLLLLHGYINGSLTYYVMKPFVVEFYNNYNVLLSRLTVSGGRRANPPSNISDPARGILLLKWSENTNAVFENMKVYAYIEGV